MKMVAAAKLHRAQRDIGALVPYSEELQTIVTHLVSGEGVGKVALAEEREVKRATVVGFASNSTLCGAYNSNTAREVMRAVAEYKELGEGLQVVTMGHRLSVELAREKLAHTEGDNHLAEHPDYTPFKAMAEGLMADFLEGRTDCVELIYHKFLSAGSQRLVRERLLPVEMPGNNEEERWGDVPYILEPSKRELIEKLIPREVALRLYTAALSALASEHAARMMAMQTATDNADELIKELSVEYNKQRQQAITNELLDIVGGQNR